MVKREMLEAYEEEEKVYLDMGKVGVKGREIDRVEEGGTEQYFLAIGPHSFEFPPQQAKGKKVIGNDKVGWQCRLNTLVSWKHEMKNSKSDGLLFQQLDNTPENAFGVNQKNRRRGF